MAIFHKNTCIRFKPHTGVERDFVKIKATKDDCSSYVGRKGGRQNLNLSPICVRRKGTIIHELMHAIGFHHEHCRPDRDNYVTILWHNIQSGVENNFKKYSPSEFNVYGGYDYGSVMHYGPYAFSRNGKPTILIRGKKKRKIGQRQRLTMKDSQKIRKMYNCKRKCK